MTSFTNEYWNERALKYGHTGHAEPFYYCFDQEARKFAIREIIKNTGFTDKNKALDFGCGSGDFLELLLEEFSSVTGFDPSEKVIEKAKRRLYKNKAVFLCSTFNEVEKNAPYNLVISVTVLQNLNKTELEKTLHQVCDMLVEGGSVICLDAFSSPEKNKEHGEDKATTNEWLEAIKKAGFELSAVYPFYNPVLFPTRSWQQYTKNKLLKSLKPFKRFLWIQKLFSSTARQIIYREKDILQEQNSIFKIYILQKQRHAN